jgi:UDP-2,3-diacylglucosamine pyrophosphatase LpxH
MNQHPIHLLSVSDLHLSATQPSPGTPLKVREGFFFDADFAKFAQTYIDQAQISDSQWHLLILGDGFDFLHTRTEDDSTGIFPASLYSNSRKKLDLIFAAHPQFFDSLGLLLANGFHLEIVPGNHDIELARTNTQAWFRQKMLNHAPAESIAERLHFHSWLYHIPGVLYAEHGNQYHDINSFSSLLDPVKDPVTGEIAHPIGTCSDLYLLHLLKHITPLTEIVRAPLPHLLKSIRENLLIFLAQTPAHLQFAWQLLKCIIQRASPSLKAHRRHYRQKNFPEYAKRIHLDPQILAELDEIAAIPAARLFSRIFDKLTRKNITNDTYILLAVSKIHATLKKHGKETAFYLFGHFHKSAKLPIDERSFYLNDGTWTSEGFPGGQGEKIEFPYAHIRWGGSAPPEAEILYWKAEP